MKKNRIITISILISCLFLSTGCSESIQKFENGIAKYLYTPTYEDKIVGFNITENIDAQGNVIGDPVKEPVFEKVITRYEPNILGQGAEAVLSLIPIPGAGMLAKGLLGAGGIALVTSNQLRRKEKKLKEENKDAELSMEAKFHVAVGGLKDFFKTEEGQVAEKFAKKAIADKARDMGVSKEYKAAVKMAKAIL